MPGGRRAVAETLGLLGVACHHQLATHPIPGGAMGCSRYLTKRSTPKRVSVMNCVVKLLNLISDSYVNCQLLVARHLLSEFILFIRISEE